MNNKLEEFIKGMGALTEMWTVTYQGFLNQGYSVTDALTHTREFTTAMIGAMMMAAGQDNKEN